MGPESVVRLEIWQAAIDLVEMIYVTTGNWPKEERFGLTAQARRAAVSIPANIAEGVGRGTPRAAAHFGQIALGSTYEVQTLICIANRLQYVDDEQADRLGDNLLSICRRLSAFIRHNRTRARESENDALKP